MIIPSYGFVATGRVSPQLELDWTTGDTQTKVDVTRSGIATFVGSNGLIQSATADTQRIDYSSGVPGLLVEEARTNLLLNSLIDGTPLGTQAVVVTATAHTLSFYGDGSVDLTGAHTATVNGSGVYPTRTTLTFTPSAGALTLTVTGEVQFAQLEAGAFPTSYIPTTSATVTRNADVATMTGTNFSDWYNQTEGSFAVQANVYSLSAFNRLLSVDDTTSDNRMEIYSNTSSAIRYLVETSDVSQGNIAPENTIKAQTIFNLAFGYKQNNDAIALNGGAVVLDTSVLIPTVTQMQIGFSTASGAFPMSGHVHKILYWPKRLTNSALQAATSTFGYRSIMRPVLKPVI